MSRVFICVSPVMIIRRMGLIVCLHSLDAYRQENFRMPFRRKPNCMKIIKGAACEDCIMLSMGTQSTVFHGSGVRFFTGHGATGCW